jgi:hypothetical protein
MSQILTYYSFNNLPNAVAISQGTLINLIADAPMTLSAGSWLLTFWGTISNTTAGVLEINQMRISFGTDVLTYVLVDQFVPPNTSFNNGQTFSFAKTYNYFVPVDNSEMNFTLTPTEVQGNDGDFEIAYALYIQKIS